MNTIISYAKIPIQPYCLIDAFLKPFFLRSKSGGSKPRLLVVRVKNSLLFFHANVLLLKMTCIAFFVTFHSFSTTRGAEAGLSLPCSLRNGICTHLPLVAHLIDTLLDSLIAKLLEKLFQDNWSKSIVQRNIYGYSFAIITRG